ncbi:MAG: hypothetical protein MZV70_16150 [Desulfobacterales bacterium]|nr:hypothetical protein [Desulfobacterales bacterium]
MTLDQDEVISISDSLLVKTLVHNRSHDPENPEIFLIKNSAACPFANIHGSPLEGSFLGAFATADLTTLHGCIVGPFAYVQVGELWHERSRARPDLDQSGRRPSISATGFPQEVARGLHPRRARSSCRQGRFMEFLNARKEDFRRVFDVVHLEPVCRPCPKPAP